MEKLCFLIPTAISVIVAAWFAARGIMRDDPDPDSYEIREKWLVLAGGILALAAAGALGGLAAYTDMLEGEAAAVVWLVGATYGLLLAAGIYCEGSYFSRRVEIGRRTIMYRNMLGVRGTWKIEDICRLEVGVETGYGRTVKVFGRNGEVLFKVETNMVNTARFVRDMNQRINSREAGE